MFTSFWVVMLLLTVLVGFIYWALRSEQEDIKIRIACVEKDLKDSTKAFDQLIRYLGYYRMGAGIYMNNMVGHRGPISQHTTENIEDYICKNNDMIHDLLKYFKLEYKEIPGTKKLVKRRK